MPRRVLAGVLVIALWAASGTALVSASGGACACGTAACCCEPKEPDSEAGGCHGSPAGPDRTQIGCGHQQEPAGLPGSVGLLPSPAPVVLVPSAAGTIDTPARHPLDRSPAIDPLPPRASSISLSV